MLTVLGGLAEFERELIRVRTGEGRKRAQARSVKFGRPPKLNAHQRKEAIARMRNGETQADIARTYGVDATTIGRLAQAAGRLPHLLAWLAIARGTVAKGHFSPSLET
jgi:DNA invertase Pin-like site-specific DNA recombinase